MDSLINGGLISSVSPSGKSVSTFEQNLLALNPIRLYPLDDFVSGIAHDLGSQKQNGSWVSSLNFAQTPGLIPGRASCAGLTAPSSPGISIPGTGLPIGANPWTEGCVVYVQFRSPSLGRAMGFNNCHLQWGTSAYQVITPAGTISVTDGRQDGIWLFVATYDGTTLSMRIDSPILTLMATSAAQTLNLVNAGAFVNGLNGDMYVQDAFWFDKALTSTQIDNLAAVMQEIQ